jgi:phosphoribosylaminoimidazole-succinocarboxamide synthase
MTNDPVFETRLPTMNLVSRGKVRDIYDLGDSLLIVATDRISAFDVVMPTPIPDKGRILTQISDFWFRLLGNALEHHLLGTDVAAFPESCRPYASLLRGRSMWVRKAGVLPVECIVRGYLVGTGWKDYQQTGQVCGVPLPKGMQEAQMLPEPIFTPSTKAEKGRHDQNISMAQMAGIVGGDLAAKVQECSLMIYRKAAAHALEKGIILADTKFEFGLIEGRLILVDEVLTPDSSRFWPKDRYRIGCSPESFDKQYLRDYLVQLGWKTTDPPPQLPEEVVANTRNRYLEALERLTGKGLAA